MAISQTGQFSGIEFVFLDRDGVINRKAQESEYVFRWDDFKVLPGVEEAIAALNRSDRHVIVVSNQRGVSLGFYSLEDVATLHARLQQHLGGFGAHIDAFYICPHGLDACDCRKPKTGLLDQAFKDYPVATKRNSLLIGDSRSDIELARNFGIPSILIRADDQDGENGEAAALASASARSLWQAVFSYLPQSE